MESWRKARCVACLAAWSLAALSGFPRLSHADGAAPANWMTGVNLSGAEYNPDKTRLNFDYTYPTPREMDYFIGKGLKTFRIPVIATRLVDPAAGAVLLASDDWKALSGLIDHAAKNAARIVIDLHQFGGMPPGLVGQNEQATRDFIVTWAALAGELRGRPNVVFGLMNEPNRQTATEWLGAANAAIAAIRKAGARQLILVPGSYWDGAHSWTSSDNAAVMAHVVDPAKNFAYEVHQYVDGNNSGTSVEAVPGAGATRLTAFTTWARAHHVKGFLGEFGFAATPQGLAEGDALVAHMAVNRDVWSGWTYWTAGPWSGPYMFSVEPNKDGDRPQLAVLTKVR